VILQNDNVLAWHKTPTTPDIQAGVELAIEAVMKKAELGTHQVESVKIGTTVRASYSLLEPKLVVISCFWRSSGLQQPMMRVPLFSSTTKISPWEKLIVSLAICERSTRARF
jgi:hypothetical protein